MMHATTNETSYSDGMTLENFKRWNNGACLEHPAGFECQKCDDISEAEYLLRPDYC